MGAAVVAAATLLALASAVHSGGGVWRGLDRRQAADARLSSSERRRAPLDRIGVPRAVFDFYASYLAPGDRVYFQVGPGGKRGLPAAFAAAGRFSLLPAVQAGSLADATVVVSYLADPGALHVPFITQKEDGKQPIYVSRISAP